MLVWWWCCGGGCGGDLAVIMADYEVCRNLYIFISLDLLFICYVYVL